MSSTGRCGRARRRDTSAADRDACRASPAPCGPPRPARARGRGPRSGRPGPLPARAAGAKRHDLEHGGAPAVVERRGAEQRSAAAGRRDGHVDDVLAAGERGRDHARAPAPSARPSGRRNAAPERGTARHRARGKVSSSRRAAVAVRNAPDGATTASRGAAARSRRTASSPSGAELRFSGSRINRSVRREAERGGRTSVRGECSAALAAARRRVREPPAERSSAKPRHLDVTPASTARTAPTRQWTALPSPWRVSRSAIGRGRPG